MPVVGPTSRFDRIAYLIRGDGLTSVVAATAILGFFAGILDASDIKWPLWVYTLIGPILTVLVLVFRRRRTRMVAVMLLFRRPARDVAAGRSSPSPGAGGSTRRGRSWVDITSTPDAYYRGGFASMYQRDASPLIVVPSNPRDLSRPDHLTQPLYLPQWDGRPLSVNLGPLVPRFQLIRNLPQGNDASHTFASRDVCYLPELGHELMLMTDAVTPLAWPEHCVDRDLLAAHDLVIMSGPDTNFWHAALFEAVARRFERPRSSIPLGAGLRDVTSAGRPVYGSSDLFVRVRHADAAFNIAADEDGEVRLREVRHPTYGFVLLVTNPLSPPTDPRWCVFVAGLRSVGTMAASLALSSMLRAMRNGTISDVWTQVPLVDVPDDTAVRCSVLVVRADTVVAAATKRGPRTAHAIPHDRPDADYRDSYVVTSAEVLDTSGDEPIWRRVEINSFAQDATAWTASRPTLSDRPGLGDAGTRQAVPPA